MRIMIVEDDRGLASALTDSLTGQGHVVSGAVRGEDALLSHRDNDLILLDLGLPGLDGHEVLYKLRRVSTVPVVVMTARGDERSVVRGLRGGADDYIVKPIRLAELLARIDAVTRRRTSDTHDRMGSMSIGQGVVIEPISRVVTVDGRRVPLTPKEFDILAVLARCPGQAVSREQLMDQLWGDAYLAVSRSLDVHIVNLRAKLDRAGLIRTIHGFGYRLSG